MIPQSSLTPLTKARSQTFKAFYAVRRPQLQRWPLLIDAVQTIRSLRNNTNPVEPPADIAPPSDNVGPWACFYSARRAHRRAGLYFVNLAGEPIPAGYTFLPRLLRHLPAKTTRKAHGSNA